ncbi:MAG: hypothetical protein SGJ27_30520 [Candidatus Melainabacteria bacterium]|nr:hypothetical protein [Candidatus Melainabacteria bacterium]
MPPTAEKTTPVVKRGKVEAADTYLGLASKLLTIFAALSTVTFWAYSTYYIGTLEIRPNKSVEYLTVKIYDERGAESVYHTGRMKVVPGRYQITATADDSTPSMMQADVKFNATTIVPYVVQEKSEPAAEEEESSQKENRRWWQIWKKN